MRRYADHSCTHKYTGEKKTDECLEHDTGPAKFQFLTRASTAEVNQEQKTLKC